MNNSMIIHTELATIIFGIIILLIAYIYIIVRKYKIGNATLKNFEIDKSTRKQEFLIDEIDNKIMEIKIQKEEELELLKEINENLKEIKQKLNS